MSNPPHTPTGDYIEHLWLTVKSGAITWDELTRLQAEQMPRCAPHNRPANVKIGGVPLCQECIRERYDERQEKGTG